MSQQTNPNMKTAPVHRVVITGMGAISPAGTGVDTFWDAVLHGRSCIRPLTPEEQERFGITASARVPDYDPIEAGFTKKESRRLSKFSQYAIIASDEAMAQAGIDMEKEDADRFACIFGSGIGGMEIFERESVVLNTKGAKRVNPLFIPIMIPNMAAGNLSIRYGLKGDCFTIVTACSTGAHCIGEAYRLIKHGYADAALAGGTEEGVNPVSLSGFGNLGAVTKETDVTKASRPFDKNRAGFVIGEGAGALVLESLEHAKARGANIIAEITGFGSTGDAYHMTAPDPDGAGAIRAMEQALAEGGFTSDDLGHLNAHGTSTAANDKTEAKALQGLAGDRAADIPVTSVKGAMGHTLGAAGALEAIATTLSVVNSLVPPTVGFSEPDPEAPVRVLTEVLTDYPQKVALSNSLGFGGHNASLAISPYTE
ncbi:beta-ketoacyl-ACP synthase II [Anaerotardibacter muris]|uniref:beta-ketoacyl-ACP synthase II n=1 Tax=Anaerotardibacter muris TaxID=2941505 RepID=UPI0020421650|nr:beta-ketoacyl-ACP synthase II [Anaerotardibacter muris]